MNMNEKYPIKYSMMPIKRQTGWSNGVYENKKILDVMCFVPMKCFLVSEHTYYKKDGSKYCVNEVVFMKKEQDEEIFVDSNVEYTLYEEVINSNSVESVFDTLEESLLFVNNLNTEIIRKNIRNLKKKPSECEEFKKQMILDVTELVERAVNSFDNDNELSR